MTSPIITEAIRVLVDRRDLTRIEAAAAMEAIMSGAATNAQIAAFLTALRMKGETIEELIGFAQVMREKVARVPSRGEETAALTGTDREMLIDTCGSGAHGSARPGAGRAGHLSRLRGPRRRWPRRDLEHRGEPGVRGPRGRRADLHRATRGFRPDTRLDRRPARR